MKKLMLCALAAVLVVGFTLPAMAVEHEFGGYWRTRFYGEHRFAGEKTTNAGEYMVTDTRTRLYYTAVLNDNLKLVNKFEMDAVWGDFPYGADYGDIGADAVAIEVKNSYADFNLFPQLNFRVGIQGLTLLRGFTLADDAAALLMTWHVNDALHIPFIWLKAYEGGAGGTPGDLGSTANERDVDAYVLAPVIYLSKAVKLQPSYTFLHSRNATLYNNTNLAFGQIAPAGLLDNVNAHQVGLDVDLNFDMFSAWFTGIYQMGTVTLQPGVNALLGFAPDQNHDLDGWLLAAGGSVNLGMFDIHGQAFYAPGDDDLNENLCLGAAAQQNLDTDLDLFFAPEGASYYWAEILGFGIFDAQVPASSPSDDISNVWAVNLGTTIKPMDKLSISFDLWYAELDEPRYFFDAVTGQRESEDELGVEADLKITYQLIEGLNLDIVGAYLWAGEAIYDDDQAPSFANPAPFVQVDGRGPNLDESDPWEVGARLSLSF
jgi:hypothetical protein